MQIIGHRGAAACEPENTLRGIRHALEAGADGVEIDVRLSQDHQLVLMHDDRVDRTTNGKGVVKKLPLAHLRELDAGKGERIPTLQEAMGCFSEDHRRSRRLFLELKEPGTLEPVLDLIRNHQATTWTELSSFDSQTMAAAKKHMPELPCAWITSSLSPDPISQALRLGVEAIHLKHTQATAGWMEKAQLHKLKVRLWTVNTPADLQRAHSLHPFGLFTDDPGAALAWPKRCS